MFCLNLYILFDVQMIFNQQVHLILHIVIVAAYKFAAHCCDISISISKSVNYFIKWPVKIASAVSIKNYINHYVAATAIVVAVKNYHYLIH